MVAKNNDNTNKKLFLCGGAELRVRKFDDVFVSEILKTESKKLLYIPIAHPEMVINGIMYTHKRMFSAVKKYFSKLGIIDMEMCSDLSNKNLVDLERYGGIYIGGGNTFSLLYDIKRSGFENILNKYINKGGIVYGSSAGAMIFGSDIGIAYFTDDPDENKVGLKSLVGLNRINNYSICAHYIESLDNKIKDYMDKVKTNVLAIPFEAGIYLNNEYIQIFTNSMPLYLFEGTKKIELKPEKLLKLRR